jgi:hypothetical protein
MLLSIPVPLDNVNRYSSLDIEMFAIITLVLPLIMLKYHSGKVASRKKGSAAESVGEYSRRRLPAPRIYRIRANPEAFRARNSGALRAS